MEKVIINGKTVKSGLISIDDRGFTLGDGLFETIPLYKGKPFLLAEHFDRLKLSAKKISLQLPIEKKDLESSVDLLAKSNGIHRGVARLTVTRGKSTFGYSFINSVNPAWTLTVRPYKVMGKEKRVHGFTLKPVPLRKHPSSPVHNLKTISSLDKIMALNQAQRFNCDEALSLTTEGYISSGAAVNIFWVRNGRLETPDSSCAILPGVTRKIAIDLSNNNCMEVLEGCFNLETLKEAEEIFVTNSLLELVPVRKINGIFDCSGSNNITTKLQTLYRHTIETSLA
ncbi:MAG TPA: aminotransferase class IV [Nitrospinota bacterium]|nr:aminotransferase class IV [Nitrospinota bacterium]